MRFMKDEPVRTPMQPEFSSRNIALQLNMFWHTPLVSSVLQRRVETLVLAGVGVVQVGLVTAHLPGWPCPIKAVLGIPCPGCGLSTACAEVLRGDWQQGVQTHAFAPLFLLAVMVFIFVSLLPQPKRQHVIGWIERFEKRTGVAAWLLSALFVYWGLRLFYII
jgi:hypothetical protein